jgi:EpsI family protein
MYSYGFAIPIIAGYVAWSRWPSLRVTQPQRAYTAGFALLTASLVLLAVGRLGALMSVQAVSLVLSVASLVLIFLGWAGLRVLWFPVGYLLLMAPIWGGVLGFLEMPGRRVAAAAATSILRSVGVPALHHGTTIILPNVSLEVMAECSGINQLLALTIMALPAAMIWLRRAPHRVALVFCAVVLGYASNALRVAILGWLTYSGIDVHDPDTLGHLAPGFISIAIAYVALSVCLSALAKNERKTAEQRTTPTRVRQASAVKPWLESLAVLLIIASAAIPVLAVGPKEVAASPSIPTHLAGWVIDTTASGVPFPGFSEALLQAYPSAEGVRRFDGLDQEVFRSYRSDSGARVRLYVAFYGRQQDGKELTGDVSLALQKLASPVPLAHAASVNEVVKADGPSSQGLVFWYQVNGRPVTNIYRAKLLTVWDAITTGRTSGAAVFVSWEAADSSQARDARLAAIQFADALLATGIRPIS